MKYCVAELPVVVGAAEVVELAPSKAARNMYFLAMVSAPGAVDIWSVYEAIMTRYFLHMYTQPKHMPPGRLPVEGLRARL